MRHVIAEDGNDRQHESSLKALLEATQGPVRIASPYITDNPLASVLAGRKVEILTSLSTIDIVSGAMSLHALKALMDAGAECRHLTSNPKFHAKVYIFGETSAVVTSANFTGSGLSRNIEVGARLTGSDVDDLAAWFDAFWDQAHPITEALVMNLIDETSGLRREFRSIKNRADMLRKFELEDNPDLLDTASRFFLCNTNRKNGPSFEGAMHDQCFAAVWEDFRWPEHMKRVQSGDLIFMFAKGIGIIGVGRATDRVQILEPGDPDRIGNVETSEWRIPVEWLVWWDVEDACAYTDAGNVSFLDVSGDGYADLREKVQTHLLDRRNTEKSALEHELDTEMRSTTREYTRLLAKQRGKSRVGSRVYQMLARHGSVGTLDKLVSRPTDGLKFLKSIDRLELSAEEIALKPQYKSIVPEEIRARARANLRKLDQPPPL